MNKKNLYASFFLNMFTAISFIVCIIITAIKNPESFKMFTVQSNLMCGIVAIVVVVFEILIILKKKEELPLWLKTVKMITTTGVALTLLVVVFYLGFVAIAEGYSYFIMFYNTNICFHLLTPLSAIISFIFFEGTNKINFKLTFLNIVHMFIYTIFYSINVLTHLNPDGSVSRKYDWYYFVNGGYISFIFIILGMLIFTYGIGFSLWYTNKKLSNK